MENKYQNIVGIVIKKETRLMSDIFKYENIISQGAIFRCDRTIHIVGVITRKQTLRLNITTDHTISNYGFPMVNFSRFI